MPEPGGLELAQLAIQGIAIPVTEAITALGIVLASIWAALIVPLIVLAAVAVENSRCQPSGYYC